MRRMQEQLAVEMEGIFARRRSDVQERRIFGSDGHMLGDAHCTVAENWNASRRSLSPIEDEGRRSRSLPGGCSRIATPGRFPTFGTRPVEHAPISVECEKRSIDTFLKTSKLISWLRRVENRIAGLIAGRPVFFSKNRTASNQASYPILDTAIFGSDVEVKITLPLFGRCLFKCTAPHKLPFALSGLCPPGARRSNFFLASSSMIYPDGNAGY